MYLLKKLHETYENNKDCIGQLEERTFGKGNKSRQVAPLLPIFHTTQNSQITIILDSKGKLIEAKPTPDNDKATIIPATEKSSGRTSGLSPHPLCDKLQYIAGDYTQYVREGKSGKASKSGYGDYVELLSSWSKFDPSNLYLQAILAFVNQGNLIEQVSAKYPDILPVSDQGIIFTKWNDKTKEAPAIFKLTTPGTPADAFIRWEVEIRGEAETRVWKSEKMYQSWIDFVVSQDSKPGLCYVTGQETSLAEQHPSKIRNAGDSAKIISSNDQAGFTYRGRFCEASEVCGIGSEVTQKAHSALRWLISRQGWTNGSLAVVAWSAWDLDVPSPTSSTNELIDEEDDDMNDMSGHTEEVIGKKLSLMINGYREKLDNIKGRNDILVLALDSASPGRLSIVYFQELPTSFYLENIRYWHENCLWRQQFSTDNIFFGAPTPKSIAETAYGSNIDEKLLRQTVRRLLPCIIENKPLPRDLVDSCIRRTSNKIACEWWEWEKMLGITCALYRYQNINNPNYSMILDDNNTDRSYLYGRLLAVAEREESYALWLNGETRSTNAEKLFQRFSERPYSTWSILQKKLNPYRLIIKRRKPKSPDFFKNLTGEITQLFKSQEEVEDNTFLSGSFLLGYYCQRADLMNKKKHPELAPDSEEQ